MYIRTKERLATGIALALIGVVTLAIALTFTEVGDANRERQQAAEIARNITLLRLVTSEYRQGRLERARVQWHAVSDRLDRLIADNTFSGTEQEVIISGLRARRVLVRNTFAELSVPQATEPVGAAAVESQRRFEALLHSRLLNAQQDGVNDAFRLTALADERISAAQWRVLIVVLAGLAIIALIAVGSSLFIRRNMLEPILRLRTGTKELAAGNLNYELAMAGNDEIGDLAKNFNTMTESLRESFGQLERSNRDLSAAEQRFRTVIEAAPTAMVLIDRAGTIVLVNAQTEAAFGYAPGELQGQALEMLVPQRFRAGHPAHRDGYFAHPQTRRMGALRNLRALRKNGSEFSIEVSLSPIETAEGTLALGMILDITERVRAADEINQLNNALTLRAAQLEATNKEMESFSYSVAHDLRAPLRSMDGFSLALLEDYGDKLDDEGKDSLERIRAASQHMGELIDDMLRLSQVTRAELKVAPMDLSAMARDCAASLEREQPERSLQWAIDEGMRVEADAPLLKLALRNLMHNACKFTAKTTQALIRVGALDRAGETVFFVADNGAGFDMAHAERLFNAFQRLHHRDEFPGTGIGLAIVQRIIHRHQGRIWAEAAAGAGATFFFTVGNPKGVSHG